MRSSCSRGAAKSPCTARLSTSSILVSSSAKSRAWKPGLAPRPVRAAVESTGLELAGETLRSELQRSPALLEKCLRTITHRVREILPPRDDGPGRAAWPAEDAREPPALTRPLQGSSAAHCRSPLAATELWLGDYYDILELSPDRLLFALGDVMGHGAPTTPIVGMMRGQLHEIVSAESRPHELLARLHQHMLRHGHPNVFMTLTLLMLDLTSLTAELAMGGPPCPLLHRNGNCTPLTSQFGWTLGYPFGGVSFQSETIPIAHGDTLLFYTDGLSDATRGPDAGHDALGTAGLAAILTKACAAGGAGIADAVCAGVEQYRAGWPVEDDATAFVVSVR